MQLRTAHVATIVVGLAIIASTGVVIVQNTRQNSSVSADKPVGTASLGVKSGTVKVGDEFTTEVLVDTGSQDTTSGVDVAISYDTHILAPVDVDAKTDGVQMEPGKLFDLVQANTVDTKLGLISFSTGQQPTGQPVAANQQVVMTLHFKALAAGSTPLKLTYTAGALDDSNVIQPKTGSDLLNHVQDGIVTVQ